MPTQLIKDAAPIKGMLKELLLDEGKNGKAIPRTRRPIIAVNAKYLEKFRDFGQRMAVQSTEHPRNTAITLIISAVVLVMSA
jgi:hypothetical protein